MSIIQQPSFPLVILYCIKYISLDLTFVGCATYAKCIHFGNGTSCTVEYQLSSPSGDTSITKLNLTVNKSHELHLLLQDSTYNSSVSLEPNSMFSIVAEMEFRTGNNFKT